MWIRITREFKYLDRHERTIIAATLNTEEFETKEQAIPEGAIQSPTFGSPIYEKDYLHYEVYEVINV